jgi:hypothetical protein
MKEEATHTAVERTERFDCGVSPYLLADNKALGIWLFAEACSCALSPEALEDIIETIGGSGLADSGVPRAFLVCWGADGFDYHVLGTIN